jgi:sulfur-carrier protein
MKRSVLLFGQLREILGETELNIDQAVDSAELLTEIRRKYPQLAGVKFVLAIDRKIVSGNIRLSNDSSIALLPPFSGG